jgi:high-affinity Fe2+/Pb2+ permease
VLEHGAFVALGLLVIWVYLLISLRRGTLTVIPFGAASTFLALMIPFFWLGPEITELTILKVGSFKTNAEQATKDFDESKPKKWP